MIAGPDRAYALAKKYGVKTAFGTDILFDGNPVENIKLLENPEKNLLVIMKDGQVYKNLVGPASR